MATCVDKNRSYLVEAIYKAFDDNEQEALRYTKAARDISIEDDVDQEELNEEETVEERTTNNAPTGGIKVKLDNLLSSVNEVKEILTSNHSEHINAISSMEKKIDYNETQLKDVQNELPIVTGKQIGRAHV